MELADAMVTGVRRAGRAMLDLLLPPLCLSCREPVDAPAGLCAACWTGLDFIAAPHCITCGLPFDLPAATGLACAACIATPPAFDRARAALAYGDGSRDLVLPFKHADRTDAAPALARLLRQAGAELLATADLIAPVPLHRARLLRRRYNQAALLALELGWLADRPVVPDLLVRRRATPSQAGRGAAERRRNVAGAFIVRPGQAVAGRRILLVDDVLTTGATVEACARTLRRAGAAGVDVLTLARVVGPRGSAI
jgi:ComF family protein